MSTDDAQLRWYFASMEDGNLYAFHNAVERDYWVEVSRLQPLTNHQVRYRYREGQIEDAKKGWPNRKNDYTHMKSHYRNILRDSTEQRDKAQKKIKKVRNVLTRIYYEKISSD